MLSMGTSIIEQRVIKKKKKKDNRPQTESLRISPISPYRDLITVFALSEMES